MRELENGRVAIEITLSKRSYDLLRDYQEKTNRSFISYAIDDVVQLALDGGNFEESVIAVTRIATDALQNHMERIIKLIAFCSIQAGSANYTAQEVLSLVAQSEMDSFYERQLDRMEKGEEEHTVSVESFSKYLQYAEGSAERQVMDGFKRQREGQKRYRAVRAMKELSGLPDEIRQLLDEIEDKS